MARIFVSFHHALNQKHADVIRGIVTSLGHTDISVNEGTKIENEEKKTDEQIRREIRDNFLKDVDITIVIVGQDTTNRKHIDWEIRSTVYKFEGHRNGGLIVVNALTNNETWLLNDKLIEEHDTTPAPGSRTWPSDSIMTLENFEWLPSRLAHSLVDNYNLENSMNGIYNHAVFPIISFNKVKNNPNILTEAINQAMNFRKSNEGKWNMDKMRRKNNESSDRKQFEQFPA